MVHMCHGPRAITLLALTLALLLVVSPVQAISGGHGILVLNIAHYFVKKDNDQFRYYPNAYNWCLSRGGVPASDPALAYTTAMANIISEAGYEDGTSFFTGSTAQPGPTNPNNCFPSRSDPIYNTSNCFYRWIYGFYDQFSYYGEIGTAFWEGLHKLDENEHSAVLNGYDEYQWNTTINYPHGEYYIINSYSKKAGNLLRSDCSFYAERSAQPGEKFVAMCEVQLYPSGYPRPQKDPQPVFVKDWEDLTWAQAHWFSIYLVILIIILTVFVLISAYCWISSRPKRIGKMITPMVIRESQGFPFAVDNVDGSAENRAQFLLNHWDGATGRCGLGGVSQFPDGEDLTLEPGDSNYRNPLIVQIPDADQSGNARCYSGRDYDHDIELAGPQESTSLRPVNDANSSTTSRPDRREINLEKSQSGRHSRKSRASACIFSEVELPDANEVHETNVELNDSFKRR